MGTCSAPLVCACCVKCAARAHTHKPHITSSSHILPWHAIIAATPTTVASFKGAWIDVHMQKQLALRMMGKVVVRMSRKYCVQGFGVHGLGQGSEQRHLGFLTDIQLTERLSLRYDR